MEIFSAISRWAIPIASRLHPFGAIHYTAPKGRNPVARGVAPRDEYTELWCGKEGNAQLFPSPKACKMHIHRWICTL
jgi:hypothetical protein